MQILIQAADVFNNIGDVSMQLVVMERLRKLWPDASLHVITREPNHLAKYAPYTIPVKISEPPQWFGLRNLLRKWISDKKRQNLVTLENNLKIFIPSKIKPNKALLAALKQSDVLVFGGSGAICDDFVGLAVRRLDFLEKAINAGKKTAMFGQGIGPAKHPELIKRMKAVLPKVDIICLREGHNALPLLSSCGVDMAKVVTTGDDAIELAYSKRADTLGENIGVCIRIARYSGLESGFSTIKEDIYTALQAVANRHKISIVPIPVGPNDHFSIGDLLKKPNSVQQPETPERLFNEVRRCRVSVVGSHHAGVYALSQGIPVICLAKSLHYVYKFSGLAEQFNNIGCEVLSYDDPQLKEKLEIALENALQNAQENRQKLLQSAQTQIQAGINAYHKFYELVENKVTHSK
ncbi:MAG: polysaccharide pyruvyl transferase family protein [Thiomargarita sp.]|nr:polysaccharide pyruvyl transferase family protein [Thiomargarita sp.]